MEQTGDATFLKSLFADQVMGSSWSHANNVLEQCPVENLLVLSVNGWMLLCVATWCCWTEFISEWLNVVSWIMNA